MTGNRTVPDAKEGMPPALANAPHEPYLRRVKGAAMIRYKPSVSVGVMLIPMTAISVVRGRRGR